MAEAEAPAISGGFPSAPHGAVWSSVEDQTKTSSFFRFFTRM